MLRQWSCRARTLRAECGIHAIGRRLFLHCSVRPRRWCGYARSGTLKINISQYAKSNSSFCNYQDCKAYQLMNEWFLDEA